MPQTTIYIKNDLYGLVIKASRKEKKTVSNFIQGAITDYITEHFTNKSGAE